MSTATSPLAALLARTEPWLHLEEAHRHQLAELFRPMQFRLGQTILSPETGGGIFYLVSQGRVRSLATLPASTEPVSLQTLGPGEAFGWVGMTESLFGETVIAAEQETVCHGLGKADFEQALAAEPVLRARFRDAPSLLEVYHHLATNRAGGPAGESLKQRALRIFPCAILHQPGEEKKPGFVWLGTGERIIGIPDGMLEKREEEARRGTLPDEFAAPLKALAPTAFARAGGEEEAVLACFEIACAQLQRPFRRGVVQRVVAHELLATGTLSLRMLALLADAAGLRAQRWEVPRGAVGDLETPALVRVHGRIGVLRATSARGCAVLVPEEGEHLMLPEDLAPDATLEVVTLQAGGDDDADEPRFTLRSFLPLVRQHSSALLAVFVASLFVQLFALANPLLTQVIIDKVLVQNAPDTLHVIGTLLVIFAVFGAILTALRTYLFVDTTNRIDLSIGTQIIDRLYRLTLPYFQKRPVGEVAARVNELENIRQFLTGTALTVVLDSVFCLAYLGIMLAYSVPLTLTALSATPVLAAITFFAAPMQRRQLLIRAQRYSETQSYLVETLGGIATVKAQSLELHARSRWQQHYVRFVSAGFTTVLTSTTLSSFSGLLARLADLGVLWVGALLVLEQRLTLGQLLAFRIIAGYVTSPLLRLVQSWQQFQEVGLSLDRLADIAEAPREQSERAAREQIPMPRVAGAVEFRDVTFAYAKNLPAKQLLSVSFEVPPGAFVGVVGQSGSGKSTLLKLLARLYLPEHGRVLIDGYDVGKVELHSLRRQIGTVMQDSLLFDGTVRENIALGDEEAPAEEIIAAAKTAVAHDFILALPEGYQTRVGEGGRALSGGQRQRVAIARVILQKPRLLVLDEATSALDFATERTVCRNLLAAAEGRTVFFVTHRLRAVQQADVILFMHEGMISERGSHAELIALRGRYCALWGQQGTD